MNPYVIITAARNEESYIERTIQSVISQTCLPEKWIIVSDGSTDRTDEIIKQYSSKHRFIEFFKIAGNNEREYSSKVHAFNFGYKQLKGVQYDFIGNLDADISFQPHYYERILDKFHQNKNLGLAGGTRYDLIDGEFVKVVRSLNSVSGAFQLFRRQCFETIDGYRALYGGVDSVAETMVRMYGWEVKSFTDIKVHHYRAVGTAKSDVVKVKFCTGINDYIIGYHPIFLILRGLIRIFHRPIFTSCFTVLGYFWAMLKGYERQVSESYVEYLRGEQVTRLRTILLTGKDPVPMNRH